MTHTPKVLIVDDDIDDLLALEQQLSVFEVDLLKATSGKKAIQLAKKEEFALIILDVLMPELGGFETARLIRCFGKSRRSPIIFLTGKAPEEESMFTGYRVGAVDYLIKPLNSGVFKSKVDCFLELNRQKRLIHAQGEALRKTLDQCSAYQEKLKSVVAQLTLSEEHLKHTVAIKLHDQVIQSLAAAKMNLDSLPNSIDDPCQQKPLGTAKTLLADTLNQVRDLTMQLYYPALSLMGLSRATEHWLSDTISAQHGLKTQFYDDGFDKPLDEEVQTLLFRSIREILNNIVQHAHAKHVSLKITLEESTIVVSIEDDGVGFDLHTATEINCGFGLLSIRESLEALKGEIAIDAGLGQGTKVVLKAPLSKATAVAP